MDALDIEIIEWVAFAKGDIIGHLFHGNQHTGGTGTSTIPRQSDPNRYQSEGRYGDDLGAKAQQLAQNPTPEGHQALATAHQAQADQLREEIKSASGEKARALEHAATAHETASLAHKNASEAMTNPVLSGNSEYLHSASDNAAYISQMATDRTNSAREI
jgi:hypothetical protein